MNLWYILDSLLNNYLPKFLLFVGCLGDFYHRVWLTFVNVDNVTV